MLNGVLIQYLPTGNVNSTGTEADLGVDVEVNLGDVKLADLSFSVPVVDTGDLSSQISSDEQNQFLAALQDTAESASITANSKLTIPELQQAVGDGKLSFKLSSLDFSLKTQFSTPAITISGGEIDLQAIAQASMIGSGMAQADFLDPLELLSVTVPGDYEGSLDGLSVRLAGGETFPVLGEGTTPTDVPEPATIWLLGPILATLLILSRPRSA